MKINLIPMAGLGQRYIDKGFKTPKPLIEIDGLPMVVRAYMSLPKSDRNILVCRKEHLLKYPIEKILRDHIPNLIIVQVDKLTKGQAMTCLLAKDFIPKDSILTIGASDNDMTYDTLLFNKLLNDKCINGFVWTFRNNPAVLQNPNMYGWVKTNGTEALEISCKKPISKDHMNDHALIGAFTFKKAKYFFDAVDNMVSDDFKINNEFYVDIAMDYCIKRKTKIKVFEVDEYICWGTPQDYINYNYWASYFKKRSI